jgi:glycosyltransferase involved in cell wall biosynthesis
MTEPTPSVSIGVPVYNGAATIGAALEALLGQSFSDFEIIISDNLSTDGTGDVCRSYADRDQRVRYFRQPQNMGATANFAFVLDQARGPFFMWAAADDQRSRNFIEHALTLMEDPRVVSAGGSAHFSGSAPLPNQALDAPEAAGRFLQFLEVSWWSHAHFYALHRTEIARRFEHVARRTIAADWLFNLHMAKHGRMAISPEIELTLGAYGVSNSERRWSAFRVHAVEYLLPFFHFSTYAIINSRAFPATARLRIAGHLARLNATAFWDQFYSGLYRWYVKNIKPIVRPHKV